MSDVGVIAVRILHVALGQVHVAPLRRPAVTLQTSNRLRQAVLAIAGAQVLHTLCHRLDTPRGTGPVRLVGPVPSSYVPEHSVTPCQPIRISTPNQRPASPEQHGLVLHAEERRVVVPHEAALELECAAGGAGTDGPKLAYRMGHAGGAVGHGEVPAALVEAVGGVGGGGPRDGEVVVGGGGGGADKGGEDGVDAGLVR